MSVRTSSQAAGGTSGALAQPQANPDELLKQAAALYKSFNPAVSTPDAHVLDKLGDLKAGGEEEDPDRVFVQQVFYGCVRYKRFIKVFLSAFYFNNAATISRSDYTRYAILCYLTVFRLNEMGPKRFRFLMVSQDATKVHHFLSFLFSDHNINVWLKDEWVKIMDRTFLENEIIGGVIHKNKAFIDEFLSERYERAFGTMGAGGGGATTGAGDGAGEGKASEGKAADATLPPEKGFAGGASAGGTRRRGKPPTKPRAPNITAPRPRLAPEPMKIQQTSVAKPVPNFLNRHSVEKLADSGAKRREELRKEVEDKYKKPENAPFNIHETRSNLEQVREAVERERYKECTFGGFKAKPLPKYPAKGADVKLNVASVLREDALYKKKQEQDAMLVKSYESELRDSTQFYQWQNEMQGRDEAARKAAVERRRMEMAASQKEAVEASRRAKAENRIVAQHMKLEKDAYKMVREAEEEAHVEAMRALVEEVKEVRATAPKAAAEKVFKARVEAREALNDELAEARALAAAEAQAEQDRKDDLIRQIRALERVPKQRVKVFDPTESSGVGLLEEMSLVELKERLAMNQAREAEAEAEKRNSILREKREKEAQLRKRIDNMSRVRSSAAKANREARVRRKQAEADAIMKEKEERMHGNLKLADRIAAKRAMRAKEEADLRAEEERIAKQRMFLGAAKAAIEERHFEEQIMGAEREARERQSSAQREAHKYEEIKDTAMKAIKTAKKREKVARKQRFAAQAARVEAGKAEAAEAEMEEIREKKAKFVSERTRQTEQLELLKDYNLYAATVTKRIKEEARDVVATRKRNATRRLGGTKGADATDEWAAFGS